MIRFRAFATRLADQLFPGRGAQSELPAREPEPERQSDPGRLDQEIAAAIADDLLTERRRQNLEALARAIAAVQPSDAPPPIPEPEAPPTGPAPALPSLDRELTSAQLIEALHGWPGLWPPGERRGALENRLAEWARERHGGGG